MLPRIDQKEPSDVGCNASSGGGLAILGRLVEEGVDQILEGGDAGTWLVADALHLQVRADPLEDSRTA